MVRRDIHLGHPSLSELREQRVMTKGYGHTNGKFYDGPIWPKLHLHTRSALNG